MLNYKCAIFSPLIIAHFQMIKLLDELTGITIALFFGVYAFRFMNSFHRIFLGQLVAYILIVMLTYIVQLIPSMNNHNQWVYNLSMPIETGILTLAAYIHFKSKKEKNLIWLGYFIFLLVFTSEIVIKGFLIFSNHGYVAECILLIVLYLLVLYSLFIKQNIAWKHTPEIWISIGIVVYFGSVLPYLSLLQYFQEYFPEINRMLFRLITVGLSNIRYLLLAYGFWLIRRNALSKTTSAK